MINIAVEWTGTIFNILGAILIARKNIMGYYFFIIAAILLLYISFINSLYGLVCLWVVYFGINIYALYYWRRKKKK